MVDEHCRKNPKSKEKFLYRSNLNYIYEKLKDKYQYKKLKRIKGYPQDKGQYDELIQFWLNYWKSQGLINEDIDPLLVKAIIACESSFRESVITEMPGSSATGLMQILVSTMNILAGKTSKEVRKFNIDISQDEAKEANSNIAAGTRWLIFKITTSPWKNKKSKNDRIYGGVKYYHSWNEGGEVYADKVFKTYNGSK
ncbi:MAG: transglycosylase SLT domain-containing protein [Bacteriovoracaceae bacterium]|jgi:hypothetical protein|nr:transglycosylase SLT domain-containing protein [Bacteriovoracaceae bacterium]